MATRERVRLVRRLTAACALALGGTFPIVATLRLESQGVWSALFAAVLLASLLGLVAGAIVRVVWPVWPFAHATPFEFMSTFLIPGMLAALVPIYAPLDASVSQFGVLVTAASWFFICAAIRARGAGPV